MSKHTQKPEGITPRILQPLSSTIFCNQNQFPISTNYPTTMRKISFEFFATVKHPSSSISAEFLVLYQHPILNNYRRFEPVGLRYFATTTMLLNRMFRFASLQERETSWGAWASAQKRAALFKPQTTLSYSNANLRIHFYYRITMVGFIFYHLAIYGLGTYQCPTKDKRTVYYGRSQQPTKCGRSKYGIGFEIRKKNHIPYSILTMLSKIKVPLFLFRVYHICIYVMDNQVLYIL